MPTNDLNTLSDLVNPAAGYNTPRPAHTTVSLIKLTQVYSDGEQQDVWVNAALVQTMAWDNFEKVTKISIFGREMRLKVTESPDDIVWLIELARP